jgi:hypothetical protein
MNPIALGAGFLAIFLIGGPLTGGNTRMSIGIGIVVYIVVNVFLAIAGSGYGGGSIESSGYRPDEGERSMTKDEWKKKNREEPIHKQNDS